MRKLTNDGYTFYTYDGAGRLAQVQDNTGTYSFVYDGMGRLTQTTTSYSFLTARSFTVSYTYDAASNRVSMTDPEGTVTTYSYDSLGRLSGLGNSWAGTFGFGYDALSRSTSLTRPNGVNTSYSYDSLSHLLSVAHQAGTTTLDGASYTYDPAGNRLSKTDLLANVTSSYAYDNIYQLTGVTQGTSTTESYSYDAVGNRLSSVGVSPYSYNSSNELTSTPSGSYTYDHNGNMLTRPDGAQFGWDYSNRLTQVALPGSGGTVTFKYDPFGRRIQKSGPSGTVNYLYDGPNLIEELDNSGTVLARYANQMRVDEALTQVRAGTTSYYLQDGLGSVTSLSNGSGALADTYTVDSYGKLTASTGTLTNPFQYTGRESDQEAGLYYYRARYYDSQIGRFLSDDPAGFVGSGVNLYAYVSNTPVNLIDPSGNAGKLPCLNKCKDLLDNIVELRNQLAQRLYEYANPKWQLPLFGRMSRQSHIDHIDETQTALRDRLKNYGDENCPDPLPVDAWSFATRPLPNLSPSPIDLPPMPRIQLTPAQTFSWGAVLIIGGMIILAPAGI